MKIYIKKVEIYEKCKSEALNSEPSRNNFFAALTHEIRQPLHSLIGTIEMLETELDKKQRNLLKNAKGSGEVLTMMINNLLDASKIEAGKFELDSERVEYRKQILKIVQILKPNAIKKDIELCLKNDPKIPKYLFLDITRFVQVLMNLVGNAIKFTQKGKVSLTSTWTPDDLSIHESDRNNLPLTKFVNERTKDLLEWSSRDEQTDSALRQLDSCEFKMEEIDENIWNDKSLDLSQLERHYKAKASSLIMRHPH